MSGKYRKLINFIRCIKPTDREGAVAWSYALMFTCMCVVAAVVLLMAFFNWVMG